MASREDINARWSTSRRAFTGTDEEFARTPGAQGLTRELDDYYSQVTDPDEIAEQIDYHQKNLGNATYGGASAGYLKTLRGQQKSLTAAKPPPVQGFGASPPPPPTAPAAPPVQIEDRPSALLPRLLDTSGPLMEKARGDAMRTANSRGLQNSSIAAGEGTKAALGVVQPLVLAEAGQASQKNLAALGFGYNTQLQAQDIEGRKQIQGQADVAAMERLRAQFESQEKMDAARIAWEKLKSGQEISSQERIAAGNWDNALRTTGLQIASNETVQGRAIDANTSTTNQSAYATGVTNANQTYATTITNIANNENIPADVRTQLVNDARALRDSTINMLRAVYNVTIPWPTSPPPPPPPVSPPVPPAQGLPP